MSAGNSAFRTYSLTIYTTYARHMTDMNTVSSTQLHVPMPGSQWPGGLDQSGWSEFVPHAFAQLANRAKNTQVVYMELAIMRHVYLFILGNIVDGRILTGLLKY